MIRIFKELWTPDNPKLEGEFYRFNHIDFSPKPVRRVRAAVQAA